MGISTLVVAAMLSSVGVASSAGPGTTMQAARPSDALRVVRDAASAADQRRSAISVGLTPAAVLGHRLPTVHGTGAFDGTTGRGEVTLRGPAGTERVVFVNQALFVRQPPPVSGTSPLPAGRSWVSAGLNESPGVGSALPQFVDQAEVVNAGLLLSELRWGAVAARSLGATQTAGIATTEYAVTLDLRNARDSAIGPTRATLGRVVGYQLAALSSTSASRATVRVNLWITGSGRVARIAWSPPGGGVGTTAITFSATRPNVHVSPPPGSQTVDVATLNPAGEHEGGLGDVA